MPFARRHWREALGSSGTAGAVADILRASGKTDGRITAEGLRWLIERCIELGHIDKLDIPGMKPERRAVIPGGLAILYTICAQFGIDELVPAKGALRQGVIVDLSERLAAGNQASGHDLRDATVARAAAPLPRRRRTRRSASRRRRRASSTAAWPERRRRDAPGTALGGRAARGRPDGVAPRPPSAQRVHRVACRRAGLLAEPAAPARRTGAGPARRTAQDRGGPVARARRRGRCSACGWR